MSIKRSKLLREIIAFLEQATILCSIHRAYAPNFVSMMANPAIVIMWCDNCDDDRDRAKLCCAIRRIFLGSSGTEALGDVAAYVKKYSFGRPLRPLAPAFSDAWRLYWTMTTTTTTKMAMIYESVDNALYRIRWWLFLNFCPSWRCLKAFCCCRYRS